MLKEIKFDKDTQQVVNELAKTIEELNIRISLICNAYIRAKGENSNGNWKIKQDYTGLYYDNEDNLTSV